jgi:WD-40 repeat-containing protein
VFNAAWVEKHLSALRPYAAALDAWLQSDGQDESRLLRGQALADAQIWSAGKNLPADDYRFLAASQALDQRVMF